MNKIKVCLNIRGTKYALTSEDSETYVFALGDKVEESIQSVMSKNDQIFLTLTAIVTALSFCDNTRKAAAVADNPRSQIKDYLEDSSRNRLEADETRRGIERTKQEIQTLRARLSTGGTIQSPAREPVRSVPATPVQEKSVPSPEPRSLEEPESPGSPFEKKQPEKNRPAVPVVPSIRTGHYSHPASVQVLEELDRGSFVGFLEKKEAD